MIELSVCIGSACHVKGSYNVVSTFRHMIEEYGLHSAVDFKAAFCMRECHKDGVCVTLNGEKQSIAPGSARVFFKEKVLPLTK